MAYRVEEPQVFDEDDVRSVLPESNDPTIAISSPDLKKKKSYWHIGTSSASRVKIDALSSDVEIFTKDATTITGTFSELWEPVETLGTAFIDLFDNICVQVHVTRSKAVAPFVVDGIIGHDLMRTEHGRWQINKRDQTFTMGRLETPISALPGRELIDDYIPTLIDRLREASIAEKTDCWALASKKLNDLRPYLPPEVGCDNRCQVIDVLDDYADIFYLPGDKLGASKLFEYPIKSKGNDIINNPQKTISQERWNDIEILISDMLKQGIIRKSTSPYNFSLDLQKTKADSRGNIKYRIGVDFSTLNDRSSTETFPIPSIIDAVDELHGEKYFSVFTLASASYHIELERQDRCKTAFTTRSGHYEFQRMPDDIKNAAQYTQRLMNEVLKDMKGKVFVCQDDILIHSPNIEEHEVRLRQVLSRVRQEGLKLQPDKCQLFRDSVTYLDHVITGKGWFPDPVKIENSCSIKIPLCLLDIGSFMNSLRIVKHFLPDYADRAKALRRHLDTNYCECLTSATTRCAFTREGRKCYSDLQLSLTNNLLLRYPDWSRKFIVETSSSKYGIQAVLKQKTSKYSRAHPIVYASRIYERDETEYDAFQLDILAYVWGKEEFRRYLQHKSLICKQEESISG